MKMKVKDIVAKLPDWKSILFVIIMLTIMALGTIFMILTAMPWLLVKLVGDAIASAIGVIAITIISFSLAYYFKKLGMPKTAYKWWNFATKWIALYCVFVVIFGSVIANALSDAPNYVPQSMKRLVKAYMEQADTQINLWAMDAEQDNQLFEFDRVTEASKRRYLGPDRYTFVASGKIYTQGKTVALVDPSDPGTVDARNALITKVEIEELDSHGEPNGFRYWVSPKNLIPVKSDWDMDVMIGVQPGEQLRWSPKQRTAEEYIFFNNSSDTLSWRTTHPKAKTILIFPGAKHSLTSKNYTKVDIVVKPKNTLYANIKIKEKRF